MRVNPKKSIRLKNRTKYFAPEKDRLCVRFSSPESYQSRVIKIEGYETRLYWQFRDCAEHGGQTFFYTLTYNDKSMPVKYGLNCFDYEDLRDLFTGGFRKQLLRKYGTTFKYFVGAELGDGKGERGLHNNPHYHVLFFLEDAHNERFPYRLIAPEQFRHLVRKYWQGFDEDTDGKQDYQTCKYGIVKEGDNLGLVTDYRAIAYVAKYVCKDVKLKMKERDIRRLTMYNERRNFRNSAEFNENFFHTVIYDFYNIPTNASHTKWKFNDLELLLQLLPEDDIRRVSVFGEVEAPEGVEYITYVHALCFKYKLWKEYNASLDEAASLKADEAINEWRNRYCNKCRISQGVGDYALAFVRDKLNPRFEVPDKHGFKARPMPMYYYRKLYTDVITPTAVTMTGKVIKYSPIRVINEDGINYRANRLPSQIRKMAEKARNNFSLVIGNEELFNKMRNSDVNTNVFYDYPEFFRRMNYLFKDAEDNNINIFERYAEYKLVYEDRHFSIKDCGDSCDSVFPPINLDADYRRFLVPSIYSVSRSDIRIDSFLKDDYEDFLSYNAHPYFLRYAGFFSVLDLCADYFFITDDNRKQAEAEEIANTKRFHKQRDLKQFYSNLGIK